MRSTIEELFYGNITRNEEELLKILTAAQKETFDKFKDSTSELEGMTEVTSFVLGFKLGVRITAEAFIGSNPEYDLIHE